MLAESIRTYYQYHFHINRKLWDDIVSQLSDEQFTEELHYSVGSVRNQVVHIMETDYRWFSELAGDPLPPYSDPEVYPTREKVREMWDEIEAMMHTYLDGLTDEAAAQPFEGITVWQSLLHVVSHGMDHRAQLMAMLNQKGIETFPQDYALYLYGKI